MVNTEHTTITDNGSAIHKRRAPQIVMISGSRMSRNKPMEMRVSGMYFNIVLSFIFYNITNIRNVFHNSYCFGKYFQKLYAFHTASIGRSYLWPVVQFCCQAQLPSNGDGTTSIVHIPLELILTSFARRVGEKFSDTGNPILDLSSSAWFILKGFILIIVQCPSSIFHHCGKYLSRHYSFYSIREQDQDDGLSVV